MLEFDEKAVIKRIRFVREQFTGPRGKSKFAQALGVSPSTYNYYEKDRLAPIPVLLKICEVSGADLPWLLTGQSGAGKMSQGRASELMQTNPELAKKSWQLADKLDGLLSSSPELTGAVLAFIELLYEKKAVQAGSSKLPEPSAQRPGWIPVLGRTAAGMVHFWDQTTLPRPQQAVKQLDELVKKHTGRAILGSIKGQLTVDLQARPLVKGFRDTAASLVQVSSRGPDEVTEFIECARIYELFPDSFALRIDGDSMSPRINDADIVILSPSVPAAQGHIAIVRLAGQIGVTCKLVRSTESDIHLIPINERYETKIVPRQDLLWALAVLCHIRV